MVEIEFSYIHDFEHDPQVWSNFMDEFSAQHGIKVYLRRMVWDMAWAELFSFTSTSNYKGPQVSHIGNTWVSSLARMNVLRPFKPDEIAEVGGAWDFITPNWETGMLPDDRRVWAIPWTVWMYVICYRKDLLEEAGIDPSEAFGTIKVVKASVERLVSSSLEIPWLNAQLPVSYRDLLHIAASWVWAAGGDFIDKKATKALFTSPQAMDGLKDWLDIYRAVPEAYKKLLQQETFDLFRAGRAAAVLANIGGANAFINAHDNPIMRNNLGVASVTETPWTGGGGLVIWDHVRSDPQKEHAAVELVKFLSSKEINLRYWRETGGTPSRIDALHEIYSPGNPAREAVMQAATNGREYYNISVWRRIEQQLSEGIGAIMRDAAENPATDSAQILRKHLEPLARRVNTTLGN
jgi:multiple sugar transport system substrate-binding protein